MLPLFHCCCSSACLFIWVINMVGSPVLSLLNSLLSHTECALHLSIRDTCGIPSPTQTHTQIKHMQTIRVSYTYRKTHVCVVFFIVQHLKLLKSHHSCFICCKRQRRHRKNHVCCCDCSGEPFKKLIFFTSDI